MFANKTPDVRTCKHRMPSIAPMRNLHLKQTVDVFANETSDVRTCQPRAPSIILLRGFSLETHRTANLTTEEYELRNEIENKHGFGLRAMNENCFGFIDHQTFSRTSLLSAHTPTTPPAPTRAEVVSMRPERVIQGGTRDQVPFEVVA